LLEHGGSKPLEQGESFLIKTKLILTVIHIRLELLMLLPKHRCAFILYLPLIITASYVLIG